MIFKLILDCILIINKKVLNLAGNSVETLKHSFVSFMCVNWSLTADLVIFVFWASWNTQSQKVYIFSLIQHFLEVKVRHIWDFMFMCTVCSYWVPVHHLFLVVLSLTLGPNWEEARGVYYDGLVGHVELKVRVSSVMKVALFNWHT